MKLRREARKPVDEEGWSAQNCRVTKRKDRKSQAKNKKKKKEKEEEEERRGKGERVAKVQRKGFGVLEKETSPESSEAREIVKTLDSVRKS